MENLIRSVPSAILVPAVLVVMALLGYLFVRSLGEGREVSFWPPRIGPRPKLPQEQTTASAPSKSAGARSVDTAVPPVVGGGRLPSVFLSSEPIALMSLMRGKGQGACFLVTAAQRSITVGRSTDCDLALEDAFLSGHHFRVNIRPVASETLGARRYEFFLVDSGSPNGTFVNGNQAHGYVELKNGDLIEAGDVSLRLFEIVPTTPGRHVASA
jgi:hypothetical protein